jgi:Na+-driven multidrug efflux pump
MCAVLAESPLSHPLLAAPIGRSLLRLAAPTTGFMAVQMVVGLAETWFIARLGTDALAGFALVFPFVALMHNIANGGMGGGVAAALARALGAGRLADARALVLHALILGLAFALLFAGAAWAAAPSLLRLMGGSGAALTHALAFAGVFFGGGVVLWLNAFLAALLRGGGDTTTPTRYGLTMSIIYVPLAGVLTLGAGNWTGLGMIGPAVAGVVTMGGGAFLQARAIWCGRLGVTPTLEGGRLQGRLFGEILHVGLMSSLTALTGLLTAMLVTGLVGRFGTDALAGYGVGMRLEFMVAPLAFGIGTGLLTMVGVASGAGDWPRAVKVAWTGGLIAFGLIGGIGWTVALLPEAWSRLFTSEAHVIAASVSYLTHVAPFYCLLGLGLALYFASQGAGRMTAPLMASAVRLAITMVGSWFAVEQMGLGIEGVFAAIAAGLAAYGGAIAGPLMVRPWRSKTPGRR